MWRTHPRKSRHPLAGRVSVGQPHASEGVKKLVELQVTGEIRPWSPMGPLLRRVISDRREPGRHLRSPKITVFPICNFAHLLSLGLLNGPLLQCTKKPQADAWGWFHLPGQEIT